MVPLTRPQGWQKLVLEMKVSATTEKFIFNANIQLEEFHPRRALFEQ